MGFLRKIADYLDPVEQRDFDASMLNAFGPGVGLASVYSANPRAAENLSTVLACTDVVSSGIASLPAFIQRWDGKGWTADDLHPVSRLIESGPNQHQTWPGWLQWTIRGALLCGNAVSEIVTDSRGAVVELRPIPWGNVSVQLLPNRRLVYDVSDVTYLSGGTGRPRRLLQDEVFHLRDHTDDGLIGVSRLRRAAAVVQSGLSMQDFANALYRNGVNPSGSIEMDGKLSQPSFDRLKKDFQEHFAGSSNAARALILDQGLKWKQISISPEDAEFLASRKFSTEELCRVFGVPPVIVGDLSNSSFNNTETLTRFFAQSTLTPWIRKIEAEFSRSVFSEASRRTHRLEIDLSGLLRGDPAQRWASWKIAVEANILTPNEIREIEGWNPLAAASPS